jgi:hypothetical protein
MNPKINGNGARFNTHTGEPIKLNTFDAIIATADALKEVTKHAQHLNKAKEDATSHGLITGDEINNILKDRYGL